MATNENLEQALEQKKAQTSTTQTTFEHDIKVEPTTYERIVRESTLPPAKGLRRCLTGGEMLRQLLTYITDEEVAKNGLVPLIRGDRIKEVVENFEEQDACPLRNARLPFEPKSATVLAINP